MRPADFDFLRELLADHAGFLLGVEKQYLIEVRLTPIAAESNLASVAELLVALRGSSDRDLRRKVVEAILTSETSFFRDQHPFEVLRDTVLPSLIERRAESQELKIWSAGCSRGQEPYSIAMLICDAFPALLPWSVRILASDVGQGVLSAAGRGCFTEQQVGKGVPTEYLNKYFVKTTLPCEANAAWQVSRAVRDMIDFRLLNLVEPWPPLPAMDVIFLRNVLIYFDVANKAAVLDRAAGALCADGFLFLGNGETTHNLSDRFERVGYGCYRLKELPPP